MGQDAATRNSLATALALVLLLASLAWHWNDRLLGSHHHRQAQTATNVETYLTEGWNPVSNIARFIPRPGIFLLEVPLYQSLGFGLVRITGLSIAQACKVINALCGLLYALGLVSLFRVLFKPDERSRKRATWSLGVVFSLPLLFAISQWVLPDMIGCVFGVWALIFFFKAGDPRGKHANWSAAAHGALLIGSFWIKPTVFVATLPFYALALWDGRRVRLKPAARVVATTVAVLVGLSWFWYAHQINERVGSPFKLNDSAYYVGEYLRSPARLAAFVGRIVIYVVGPGTIVALAWGLWRTRVKSSPERLIAAACGVSFGLYTLIFITLNVRHNYYQLPLLIPVSLAVQWLGASFENARKQAWSLVAVVAVALNIGTAEYRLLRNDADLDRLVVDLGGQIRPGVDRRDVNLTSDADLAPVLSYYLTRWVEEFPLEDFTISGPKGAWLGVCDEALGVACRSAIVAHVPACAARGTLHGRFWVCMPEGSGLL